MERAIRTIVISILAPIIVGALLHYLLLFPLPFVTIICILAFLVPFIFDQYLRSRELETRFNRIVHMIKLVVDALMGIRVKLSQLPRDKSITVGYLTDILDGATSAISEGVIDEYFKGLQAKSSNPSSEERRKRELLEKARRRRITYEEGEELRRLLEKQKRDREQAGDIFGAILVGLLILFVLGVLAALFAKEGE
jgi:Flp pilus assembly protein TadB